MLSPRLTNCPQCTNITSLISVIDCRITEVSNALYNNIVFMLNKTIAYQALFDLLQYKRILMYKICNPDYAGNYTVNMIASKVNILKFK